MKQGDTSQKKGGCRRQVFLVDYLYGGLSEEDRRSLRSHLDGCGSCRRELAALKATRKALDERPIPEPDPGVMAEYVQFLDRLAPGQSTPERFFGWVERWIVRPPATLRLAEVGLALAIGFVIGSGTFLRSDAPQPGVVRIYTDAATLQQVLGDAEMIILETVNSDPGSRSTEVDTRIVQSIRLLGQTADIRSRRDRHDPELEELMMQLTDIIRLISMTGADDYSDKLDSIRERVQSSHILSRIASFKDWDGTARSGASGI